MYIICLYYNILLYIILCYVILYYIMLYYNYIIKLGSRRVQSIRIKQIIQPFWLRKCDDYFQIFKRVNSNQYKSITIMNNHEIIINSRTNTNQQTSTTTKEKLDNQHHKHQ